MYFGVVGFPLMMRNEAEFDFLIEKMGGFFEAEFKKTATLCFVGQKLVRYIYSKSIDSEDSAEKSICLARRQDYQSIISRKQNNANSHSNSGHTYSLKTGQIDTVFHHPMGLLPCMACMNYVTDFPMTFMLFYHA